MSLKINSILPKHQSTTQPKPKITPKVADKTKQKEQAINRLAVRFGGDEETTPPKKTVNDFYQKVLKEQPLNEKDREKKIKIPINLSKNATLEDYRLATDKAILQKAGYSMLDKSEVETARGLMGMKDKFDLKNIKDLDKANKLFVTTSQHSIERAKIAGQAVLQFREYESKLKDTNNAEGENETNRIGKDIGGLHYETFRKIGDGIVNIVPDTINALFGGKTGETNKSTPNFGRAKIGEMYDDLAKTDAEVKIPRIDTSGIMSPYKFESQMMRRNLNGIVDGEGSKAGDTISTGASIVAPLVLGKISTPAKVQSLGTLARPIKSVWNMGPAPRGRKIEDFILGRKPTITSSNFPIIDDYANGVATSIKSIELTGKAYQNPKNLTRILENYANKLSKFETKTWKGQEIPPVPEVLKEKVLLVTFEKDVATVAQQKALDSFLKNAKQKYPSIVVKFEFIR